MLKFFFLVNLSLFLIVRYTFLLDKTGLVRWRGSGFSTDEELDSLFFCAKQLLQEGLKKEILQELP